MYQSHRGQSEHQESIQKAPKRKPPTHLDNKLRDERQKRIDLTRKGLAEKIGASPDSIEDWEKGYLPSDYFRRELCKFFDKSEEELWPSLYKTTAEKITREEQVTNNGQNDNAFSNNQTNQSSTFGTLGIEEQKQDSKKKISRRELLTIGLVVGGVAVAGGLAVNTLTHHGSISDWFQNSITTPTVRQGSTPLLVYPGHFSWMTTARWSPNGMQIASGGADKTVQIWSPDTVESFYTYRGHSDIVLAAEWSSNGMRIASSGNDATAQVWDSFTGDHVLTYRGHKGRVYALAWSPDSKRIVSAGADDGTVQIWDAVTGTHIFTYRGHSGQLQNVAWSPDGKTIASAGKVVKVWDATTGTTLYTYQGHSDFVRKVVWSPDGTRIASGSHDWTVHIWDAFTGEHRIVYHGHSDEINDIGWSSIRHLIASSGRDQTVQIWNPLNAQTIYIYKGHHAKINALGWSPDGKRLVSGDDNASVQVWKAV